MHAIVGAPDPTTKPGGLNSARSSPGRALGGRQLSICRDPRKRTQGFKTDLLTKLHRSRTARGMDGTLPKCNFENLKPVEIS